MKFSEKWGKDIDDAVELALHDLNLNRDQVNIIVLEEPSKGFFGIGSKLALVRVEKKEETEAKSQEEDKKEDIKKEKISKPVKQKKQRTKRKDKAKAIDRLAHLTEIEEDSALDFLKDMISKMKLNVDVKGYIDEDGLFFNITGSDAGTIIGKRGQTLDSIQYLTSLVANKDREKYVRVVVDAENYRSKREKTLENLATRLGNKVKKTGKTVRLEPMNPYERKVIHATLQKNPAIVTRSEGEDPYRRVVIERK